jgi:hypothetical protein
MRKILLFVHGTGVRAVSYAAASRLIKRQLERNGLNAVEFAPCLWGEKFGAKLARDGKSIPTYGKSRSLEELVEHTSPALWTLLVQDPTFELSALSSEQATEVASEAAAQALLDNFEDLGASKDFHTALADMGLDHLLEQRRVNKDVRDLLSAIGRSEGFQECALLPIAGQARHRDALARAVVASLQRLFLENSMPLLDAPHRDELVMRVGHLLSSNTTDVIDVSLAPLKGLATYWATWKGRRNRTSLTDASYPAAGDILRYQLHGKELRDYIAGCVNAFPKDEVFILAHSLGGVATFETLVENDLPNVKRLITFGSQAPFFYEIGALKTLPLDKPFPETFPAWSNFYDLNDPLSYVGEFVFKDRVTDYPIESGESFPASHSAYLHSTPFWQQVAALIKDAV